MCNTQSFRPVMKDEWKSINKQKCPKCGYPQFCGCPSCKDKIPEGFHPYKWDFVDVGNDKPKLEVIICANCGYDNTPDGWLEFEETL